MLHKGNKIVKENNLEEMLCLTVLDLRRQSNASGMWERA